MPRGISRYDEARLQRGLWTPRLLGPALVEWWDPTDLSTFQFSGPASAPVVAQWAGKIKGILAGQGTAANRPGWSPTARNGTPGLVFSGGQSLTFPTANIPTGAATATLFVSAFLSTGGADSGAFGWGAAGSSGSWRSINNAAYLSNVARCGLYGTDYNSNKPWVGNNYFIGYEVAAGAQNVYIDGVYQGSTSATPNTSTSGGTIGANPNGTSPWQGTIGHCLVTNIFLSPSDREKMAGWESWVGGRAGSNLAPSNRFRNRPPLIGD